MGRLPWKPTRDGQWVKFKASLPRAVAERHTDGFVPVHKTPDGFYVGVYRKGTGLTAFVGVNEDARATEPQPERVVLMAADGENVDYMKAVDGQIRLVPYVVGIPEASKTWEPLLDLQHLPPGRKVAPGWLPKP